MKNSPKYRWQKILLIPVIITGIILWSFINSNSNAQSSKEQMLLSAIGAILEQRHFSPKPIDDKFSAEIFTKYLSTLDPDKNVYLQEDIAALEQYKTKLDDEIHGEPLSFYLNASSIFMSRLSEVMNVYSEQLQKPFNFNIDENIQLDAEKKTYPTSLEERKELWRKRVKYLTLERYAEAIEQRNKNKDTDTAWDKTDAQLEADSRQKVKTSLDRAFNRQKQLFTPQEQFNTYVNVVADLMDPHTEYFPPIEKRQFDEEMSGRFYGIGAQLKEDDGAIKIASLVTGMPAWKSGEVQVNDEVIKVAQGSEEPVDVRGYAVTDAVKLIRGNKGTEVKITFKKPEGTIHTVSIIRDEIVLDETFARSAVINENGNKIGYIYLPEFYADLNRLNGNRASVDVSNEIVKLKKENVSGIILDLRNNGGGSLYEVVQMVGLFIKEGPVVQVKDRDGSPAILRDNDPGVLYTGPLAVMVNELSASASEIFAAAIQDYKRGVIVGSTSTYGKGTVQKPIPLGRSVDAATGQTEYGALKLTFEKFYRINGGSTQLKGVVPDIILPDSYEYIKFREKDNPSSLPWDQISKADYSLFSSAVNWNEINEKANERLKTNEAFAKIKDNATWININADKEYSLNLKEYKEEQQSIRNRVKQNDSLTRLSAPIDIKPLEADKERFFNNPDKAKSDRYQQWLKNIQSDIYINETKNILTDIANSSLNTNVKK